MLEELATMFSVSKQRINQIIASAIRHIFKSEEAFLFTEWLPDPKKAQEYLKKGREFYANPKNEFKIFKDKDGRTCYLNENETKEVITHKKKPINR